MKNMESSLQNKEAAILTTLLYSDIFNFPLSKEEIWRFLIGKKKISKKTFEETFASLCRTKQIVTSGSKEFYCFAGREKILVSREENLVEVTRKLTIAQRAASFLSYIPTIQFIGISGGLAVGNAKQADDIDFFIITKKNTLFVTRLVVLALLEFLQLRRARTEKSPANKICVNLLIEETVLVWPTDKRNLYTAHEIVQILPLFERERTYAEFLGSNTWVKKFLPYALEEIKIPRGNSWRRNYVSLTAISYFITLAPFEILVRKIQKRLIEQHKTKETVANHFLAFHPIDYNAQTLGSFRKKTQRLGLLTKG